MEKKIVVCGSIAYDHVMRFMGEFEDSLKGQDLSKLSVSYLAMNRDVNFGGCAGNISYNLSLIGLDPVIVGAVGNDFERYEQWLQMNRVNCDYVQKEPYGLTASAFILTDSTENQITIFAPESMAAYNGRSMIEPILADYQISVAIISPDFPARMNQHVADCKKHNIPYVFDPGQAIPALSAGDLNEAVRGAKVLISNDFELGMLTEKMGMNVKKLLTMTDYIVETLGARGSIVRSLDGHEEVIEAVRPRESVDPTGCGDAFRAGLLKALHEDDNVIHGCRLGAVIASYNVEQKGTQNHRFTMQDLVNRMGKAE